MWSSWTLTLYFYRNLAATCKALEAIVISHSMGVMTLSEDTNILFFFAVDCGSPGWSGWMPNCYCKNYIIINPHFPSIRHRQFLSYYTLTSFYYYLSEFTLVYGLYLKQRNKLFCLFVFSLTYRCRIWIIIIKSRSFGTKEPGKRDNFIRHPFWSTSFSLVQLYLL